MIKEFKPETDKCPVCNSTWKKTNFGAKTWYDCIKCNKTAEDIVVLKKSSPSGTKEYKLGDMEDWEHFLMEFDLEDFDDIFLKSISAAERFDITHELFDQGIIETHQEYLDWMEGK